MVHRAAASIGVFTLFASVLDQLSLGPFQIYVHQLWVGFSTCPFWLSPKLWITGYPEFIKTLSKQFPTSYLVETRDGNLIKKIDSETESGRVSG